MKKAINSGSSRPPLTIAISDFEHLESLADTLPPQEETTRAGLMGELVRAHLVPRDQLPSNTVAMNSKVRFRLNGREMVMTLAYPSRQLDSSTHISIFTPVGSALLGLQEGASITWPSPTTGSIEIEVIEVLPES